MVDFLKGNARATTIALAVLMLVVAAGGFWSGDGVSKVAGVLGFMLFLWPVLFLIMVPLRLLARVNQKAAAFGSSIGRQAVASPRKSAAQAISDAADEAIGKKAVAVPKPRIATGAAPATPLPRSAEVTPGNANSNTSSDEGTPAEARRMAEQFVALTERKFGFRLNYSPETLGPVDLLVDKVKATGVSEQDGSGMIYSIGCYVGEVMVRHVGGEWRPTAELNMQQVCSWPLVIRMPDGAGFNPIGKAFKRFRNGEGDSLAYFYQMALKMPEIIERSQAK